MTRPNTKITSTNLNTEDLKANVTVDTTVKPEEASGLVPKKRGDPFDFWTHPLTVTWSKFIHKSLCDAACNIAVGCGHGCRFCYVPDTATRKQGPLLAQYGVVDPDAEWGDYGQLRPWDKKKFLSSLDRVERTRLADLSVDGNRAIMFCTTTDPYTLSHHPDPERKNLQNRYRQFLVREAITLIRDHSTLNIRVQTRSPLAKQDFELYKTLGNRLVFGMSLPTLNNQLAKIYEPRAPAPTQRLATLKAAKAAGLHVYVAMAPTYPECGEEDIKATLQAIKELEPITIYHEPINVRAENVARIHKHAEEIGETVNTAVFANTQTWRRYALASLIQVQQIATELNLQDRLHLWPDPALNSRDRFMHIRKEEFALLHAGAELTEDQKDQIKDADLAAYQQHLAWLEGWWSRVSEWPGKAPNPEWQVPALPTSSPFDSAMLPPIP